MSATHGSTRPLVDVRLEALSTRGGRPPGVYEVGVHVRYGEFFTFLGPPKSGKSDVLRALAGFLPMTSGRVLVDGQDISLLPPRARGLGYVFQEGALWSHLTVAQHIAFGLEQQGLAGAEVARKVETVAGRLGLAGLEARRPPELSIEQRRRLAIARALAVEPRVLLLDEPLANVDPAARKTLRLDLAKLHRDLAVTTIHATRNAADALALSDRLAVMGDGRAGRASPGRSRCASSRARATSTRSRSAGRSRCASRCPRRARRASIGSATGCVSRCRARRSCWCQTPSLAVGHTAYVLSCSRMLTRALPMRSSSSAISSWNWGFTW